MLGLGVKEKILGTISQIDQNLHPQKCSRTQPFHARTIKT